MPDDCAEKAGSGQNVAESCESSAEHESGDADPVDLDASANHRAWIGASRV